MSREATWLLPSPSVIETTILHQRLNRGYGLLNVLLPFALVLAFSLVVSSARYLLLLADNERAQVKVPVCATHQL